MVLPTVFSAHAPAAEHRARRTAAGAPAPAVILSPLDAFLLTRLATYLPHPLTVLDLAADATDGDSVAVLRGAGVAVVSPRLSWAPAVASDWRPLVRAERDEPRGTESLAATAPVTLLDAPADNGVDAWRTVQRALPTGGTTLVLLAETCETARETGQHLEWLAERLPDAPIVLLPLGATGDSELLTQALLACPPRGPRRFVALRERAPFFASSDLGLIFPADDTLIPVALDRLDALVTGNFQFLPLVRDAVNMTIRLNALESELTRLREGTDARMMMNEMAREQAEAARIQEEEARERTERALTEKCEYAVWLEERLTYLEEEYLPWKNAVLTGLETDVRNLRSNKLLRAERLLRRAIGLVRR